MSLIRQCRKGLYKFHLISGEEFVLWKFDRVESSLVQLHIGFKSNS